MTLAIPAMMMRGGTSRAMYFLAADLPRSTDELNELLPRLMGSPDSGQVDGLGGGSTTTSKVAIISPSSAVDCDVDYLFAQVSTSSDIVDWAPTCGNVLSGVGPFAIERGLVTPCDGSTVVRVRMVNTNARADCVVSTPGGQVEYEGPARVGGVTRPAASVELRFRDFIGGTTGSLLPTGSPIDVVDGVEFSGIDAGVCAVIVRASELGLTGYESASDLNRNAFLLQRLSQLRRKAAMLMGMGEVNDSVLPKVMLVAPPLPGLPADSSVVTLTSRYFVPATCHPAHAVSGAICLATGAATSGTLPAILTEGRLMCRPAPTRFDVAHPSGVLSLDTEPTAAGGYSARVSRTARKLFDGQVFAQSRRAAS